jgi:hypothetical protein
MESVYGRRVAAVGTRETWMEWFARQEPEGGAGTVVRQVWNRSALATDGASSLNSLNGRMEMKPVYHDMRPVYGQKRLSADAGVRETWMDRFTKLEPKDGVRAIVERAWNRSTPTSDRHLTTLAAWIARAEAGYKQAATATTALRDGVTA